MITVSIQLAMSLAFCMGAAFTALGIFLERLKVRQEQVAKMQKRTDALYNQPERVCGEFVWFDHKHERAHHCTLPQGEHYIHRAANGMGRKTYA